MGRLLDAEHECDRIGLGLLSWLESEGARSQPRNAAEIGIGLVNAYPRPSIKKGFVTVRGGSARRNACGPTAPGLSKGRLARMLLAARAAQEERVGRA